MSPTKPDSPPSDSLHFPYAGKHVSLTSLRPIVDSRTSRSPHPTDDPQEPQKEPAALRESAFDLGHSIGEIESRHANLVGDELRSLVGHALQGIFLAFRDVSEPIGKRFEKWVAGLHSVPSVAAFTSLYGHPMVIWPYWFERRVAGYVDNEFQTALIRSSLSGYLFIRLVDNVHDGHGAGDRTLLPALSVLATLFLDFYYRTGDQVLINTTSSLWSECSNAAFEDSLSTINTADVFERISARKSCAAEAPIHAVKHRYGVREEVATGWLRLLDIYGRWHQFTDDLRDWKADLQAGRSTYVLEHMHTARPEIQSERDWMVMDGFEWAMIQLDNWMLLMKEEAAKLEAREIRTYLALRNAQLLYGAKMQAPV